MFKLVNKQIVVAINGAVSILDGHWGHCTNIYSEAKCIDGNEQFIAVGYKTGSVWFCKKNLMTSRHYKHDGEVNSIAISGALLASASDDNQVHVWDMRAKKELYRLKHDDNVSCIAFY